MWASLRVGQPQQGLVQVWDGWAMAVGSLEGLECSAKQASG